MHERMGVSLKVLCATYNLVGEIVINQSIVNQSHHELSSFIVNGKTWARHFYSLLDSDAHRHHPSPPGYCCGAVEVDAAKITRYVVGFQAGLPNCAADGAADAVGTSDCCC